MAASHTRSVVVFHFDSSRRWATLAGKKTCVLTLERRNVADHGQVPYVVATTSQGQVVVMEAPAYPPLGEFQQSSRDAAFCQVTVVGPPSDVYGFKFQSVENAEAFVDYLNNFCAQPAQDAGTMHQQQTAHTPASPSRSGTSSVESTGKVTTTLAATAPQAKPRSNQRGRFPSASASHSATVPTNRDRVEAQFFATVGRQNSYDHGGRQDNGVHDQYAGGNMVSLPTNSVAQIEPVDTESGRAVDRCTMLQMAINSGDFNAAMNAVQDLIGSKTDIICHPVNGSCHADRSSASNSASTAQNAPRQSPQTALVGSNGRNVAGQMGSLLLSQQQQEYPQTEPQHAQPHQQQQPMAHHTAPASQPGFNQIGAGNALSTSQGGAVMSNAGHQNRFLETNVQKFQQHLAQQAGPPQAAQRSRDPYANPPHDQVNYQEPGVEMRRKHAIDEARRQQQRKIRQQQEQMRFRQQQEQTRFRQQQEALAEAAAAAARKAAAEPVGWTCPVCTLVNPPTRPGCEACSGPRPDDYVVPQNYELTDKEREFMRKSRDSERMYHEAEEAEQRRKHAEQQENYQDWLRADDMGLVPNADQFDCPVCLTETGVGEGAMLRECLHTVCRECLCEHIKHSEDADVKCPCQFDEGQCNASITEREIRELLGDDIQRWWGRGLRTAEQQADNSYHCKTPDCPGWCIYEDEVETFLCPLCHKENCLMCKAIHTPMNCKEYQDDVKRRAANDEAARATQEMLEGMVRNNQAMRCPKCNVIVQKASGCDWMRCLMCKTELCWATKGPRWGPKGNGDRSGGCQCRVGGKKCAPHCVNCH